MNSSTVSAKYQIVIPKNIRRSLGIEPGQRMYLSADKGSDTLIVQTKPDVKRYVGVLQSSGEDPVVYQRRIREDKRYA
jgi:AbrB family looped-hinge helix DNA binding protein